MKKILGAFFLFYTITAAGQNNISNIKLTSSITTDVGKVATDYYYQFNNIKGEKISETDNIIEYSSKITPHGALESTIIQIKNLENSYSWQALMLDTEDYKQAVTKYKLLYKQLNGARLSFGERKFYTLKGIYDAPDETRGFASTLLALETTESEMRQFKIEVALNYAMPEWSVKIFVYEKEDDADIRPTVNSDY
ncbi:MAG: hypothetical protein ABIO76_01400 [Ginsengibacter sp.]